MRNRLIRSLSVATGAALAVAFFCGVSSPRVFAVESDSATEGTNSPLLILWGLPGATRGDAYTGPGPTWWLGGGKAAGEWTTNGWSVASNAEGSADLLMFLDRGCLTNNLRLDAELTAAADASLQVDLLDSRFQVVKADVLGNVATMAAPRALNLPLATSPSGSIVRLRRTAGDVTVRACSLYIDEDGDGLDAAREQRLGTSDTLLDSDGDGLSDAREVAETGTNPAALDSDFDGVRDSVEILRGGDPLDRKSVHVTIHVNADTGNDAFDGTSATPGIRSKGPLRTIEAAARLAISGDTLLLCGTNCFQQAVWDFRPKELIVRSQGPVKIR